MNSSEILSHIDHTLLKATASWSEIQQLCDEASRLKTASVCIPPSFVKRVHEAYGDQINICTVIGFPLGYHEKNAKLAELVQAREDGAAEFDMVVNLGDIKDGHFDKVTDEIRSLKDAADGLILKVIIETCYLTEDEKIALCSCVTNGGADYIKTSTGFGTAGATIEDVRLFKAHIGPSVKIKAAGGVRTREDLELFLAEGCDRIGTSSAVKLLSGETATAY